MSSSSPPLDPAKKRDSALGEALRQKPSEFKSAAVILLASKGIQQIKSSEKRDSALGEALPQKLSELRGGVASCGWLKVLLKREQMRDWRILAAMFFILLYLKGFIVPLSCDFNDGRPKYKNKWGDTSQLSHLSLHGKIDLITFEAIKKCMKNLTKLQHLDLDIVGQLSSMPSGMGNLINLQNLSGFIVDRDDGFHICELKNLNNLRGEICISRLERVPNSEEAMEAALLTKNYLNKLELRWSDLRVEEAEVEEGILELSSTPFWSERVAYTMLWMLEDSIIGTTSLTVEDVGRQHNRNRLTHRNYEGMVCTQNGSLPQVMTTEEVHLSIL
uniref:R13L1/DRL21-like LRR repeat region domain-containing protein n=1 Tax=Fagus sylvatica TaxID=28930 RepID=A0A2N9IE67_FAGSY